MKTLYEASNAIEAHMLVDLLKQEGLTAHIRGEYLQGAAGEIPAAGMVRLEIDASEFDQARNLINRWESTQPADHATRSAPKKSGGIWGLFLGIIVGFGSCYALYLAPISSDGIDHNGDGVIDERWMQSPNGSVLSYEADRNLDGKVDLIGKYNKHGSMKSADSDENFDDVFETQTQYTNGYPSVGESDTDSDGFHDLVISYTHGVLTSQAYISPITGKKLKVEHFKLGKLMSAEVDTNKDGTLDTRHAYDHLGELKASELIHH